LGWIGFCKSYHVLLFHEVKILSRRYLLLRCYGRYGRLRAKPTKSGLGAACTAHHYTRPTASAPPPAKSFGIRRPTAYAPVASLSCVVKAHPSALVLWPRCRGRPARQRGLPWVAFRTPCPVCIVPLPRWRGGALVIIYHLLQRRPLSRH
jgi:hypothetical protein